MPNNILKPAVVIFVGTMFGYSLTNFYMTTPKIRQIASSQFGKMGQHTNIHSTLDVKVIPQVISENDSDISVLTARVTAFQNLSSNLSFKWNLPDGVQILESPQNGDIGPLNANEYKEFELRIRGFSKAQQKHIVFEVKGEHQQRPIKLEIFVPSRMEDTFEHQIKENEKKNAQNKLDGFGDANKRNKFDPSNVIE